MARALLITNPVAARTDEAPRTGSPDIFARAGWNMDIAVTTGPEDAREMARQGVASGVDVVAVFAGDGTTMQAAAALVGSDVPLALIPGGTGNLLAGNLRIPASPVRAAQVLMTGRRRRIDLGRVVLPDGEHYFGVAVGAGVDAQVMGSTATATSAAGVSGPTGPPPFGCCRVSGALNAGSRSTERRSTFAPRWC